MARRWTRRALMIGAYAIAWVSLTGLAPLFVLAAALHDVARRTPAAAVRLVVMLWVFLGAELLGVTLAGLAWLRHVLTPGRDHDQFLEDNYLLQAWWGRLLLGVATRVMRLRLSIEGDDVVLPGPVVVLMRHASIVDTILPIALLGGRGRLRPRYVLKKELLIDPCLDIVGNRLPNCFVDRAGDTAREVELVGRLADELGPRDGVLIYPEGTRFTPRKLERARARLAERNPELHALSAELRHVLPPRPGGTLALLERALPQGADVVIFAHVGLERLVRFHDALAGALVGAHVQLRLWRIPGAKVPEDRDARVRWLFQRWAEVEEYAATTTAPPPSTPPRQAATTR